MRKPKEASRVVPSHISLVVERKASVELRAYSRNLGEKLDLLFPTRVCSEVGTARAPLVHFQCGRDPPMRYKGHSGSPEVYAVATVHAPPGTSQMGPFLDGLDGVVVHSRPVRDTLSEITDTPVTLMPLAFDNFQPVPRDVARMRLSLPAGGKVVLCLGYPGGRDAFRDVIAVASRIPEATFATNTGHKPRSFFPFAQTRDPLPPNIAFFEAKDKGLLQTLASACDALLVMRGSDSGAPSALHSLQRVLGVGKPVVGEKDDLTLAELGDGTFALRYSEGDPDSLEGALRSVLSGDTVATALSERAMLHAAENSWENLARRHVKFYGDLIGDVFGKDWYDEEYYVGARGGKEFFSSGKSEHWSYFNPQGEWTGARAVMQAIKSVLGPASMLSVGEGRGTFVAYASELGMAAKGVDFSHWAVDHPHPGARGLLEWGDARDLSRFADDSFDLLFVSDLMEHVYIEDLDRVIGEVQRVSRRWVFYNNGGTELGVLPPTFIRKGELPPKELQGTAVAGHVILQPCSWWEGRLTGGRWRSRPDLVSGFRDAVGRVDPHILGNWKCVIITEKIQP